MVKTKTSLDPTQLNVVNQTPYMDIDSEKDATTDAQILKAKAVILIDPLTGRALGASDFFLALQTDAVIAQVNPVSSTLYPVLAATSNCQIIGVSVNVVWTVQPNPLEVVMIIDGITYTFTIANPVSATNYFPRMFSSSDIPASQVLGTTDPSFSQGQPYQVEGRSIAISARTTGGTTQALNCRVRYAKR